MHSTLDPTQLWTRHLDQVSFEAEQSIQQAQFCRTNKLFSTSNPRRLLRLALSILLRYSLGPLLHHILPAGWMGNFLDKKTLRR